MIRFFTLIFITALLFSNTAAFAFDSEETVYHCPSINEIKYKNGTFIAETSYNGIHLNWFTVQNFPTAEATVTKFHFTNNWNGCIGGKCAIYCVYDIQTKEHDFLKFSVSRNEYEFTRPVNGPWNNGICESDKPEDCTFMIVKNDW